MHLQDYKTERNKSKITKIIILILVLFTLSQNLKSQVIDTVRINKVFSENTQEIGSVHLLLSKNNNIVYSKSFGKGTQLINENTRIKISTASLWLASAAILAVLEKNNISIDTEIKKVLPQFQGEKGNITFRQLLSHTSGLPTNSIYLKNRNITLAQSVDSIAKNVKLLKEPGKTFSYGGVSIQIAARAAEVISKKSWEQLFFDEIAKPCQMFVTDFGKAKSTNVGDGAYSSAKDYNNFLKMILNKGVFNNSRVLSENMINEMLTDNTSNLPLGYTPYRFRTSQNSRHYGLGVWIERIDPKTKIATEVNCQGARGFTPWLNTCKNLTGIISTNDDLKTVQNIVDAVKEIYDKSFSINCKDVLTNTYDNKERIVGVNELDIVTTPDLVTISFSLEKSALVSLKFFDSLGNEIDEIVNKNMNAGEHIIPYNISELPSGIYFYRLKVNDRIETKKISIKK